MADPTDEIERIRARLATNDGAVPFSVARTLLSALDAERAEVERLRGELDGLGSWRGDFERVRRHISTDPLAGAATVIADHNAAKQRVRDQARRAALEEAIAQVDEAITIHLGHANAGDTFDWLSTVRDHIQELLDGPDATEGT